MLSLKLFKKNQNYHSSLSDDSIFNLENFSYSSHLGQLDEISLCLGQGELLFLFGGNNSGKSLLSNVLSGQSPFITRSSVLLVRGEDSFFSKTSLRNNLMVSYRSSQYQSRGQYRQILLDLCDILELTNCLDKKVCELSKNEKQRASILRAILAKPKAIVIDNAFSEIDISGQKKIFEIIHYYIQKKYLTVIWLTSNKEVCYFAPDRTLELKSGKIIQRRFE